MPLGVSFVTLGKEGAPPGPRGHTGKHGAVSRQRRQRQGENRPEALPCRKLVCGGLGGSGRLLRDMGSLWGGTVSV